MKGTDFTFSLACSEKNYGDRLYLACSYEKASEGVIARVYKLRWTIGVSGKGLIVKQVKVLSEQIGLKLRSSGDTMAGNLDGEALRQIPQRRCAMS